MEYIKKYATEDQITQNLQYKETVGDKYFDKHGVLQPGHANKFEVHHFSLLALMEWGQQNPFAKKKCIKNIACVSLPMQRYLVMKYKLWYP